MIDFKKALFDKAFREKQEAEFIARYVSDYIGPFMRGECGASAATAIECDLCYEDELEFLHAIHTDFVSGAGGAAMAFIIKKCREELEFAAKAEYSNNLALAEDELTGPEFDMLKGAA